MDFPFHRFSQASRVDWGRNIQKKCDLSTEEMQLGALYRIAISTERLVQILECTNFQMIPAYLKEIRKNTKRKKCPRLTLKK